MTAMVDGVLAVVAVEIAFFLFRRRFMLLPNLLAGLLLLAALRLSLAGAGLPVIGLCLLGAGLAHVGDLAAR